MMMNEELLDKKIEGRRCLSLLLFYCLFHIAELVAEWLQNLWVCSIQQEYKCDVGCV